MVGWQPKSNCLGVSRSEEVGPVKGTLLGKNCYVGKKTGGPELGVQGFFKFERDLTVFKRNEGLPWWSSG